MKTQTWQLWQQSSKMQNKILQAEQSLSRRQYHPHYDRDTYYSEVLFEIFKASKNQSRFLKLIWTQEVNWPGDRKKLAMLCPDRCPVLGTPLDYGRGLNRVFNPFVSSDDSWFQPTIDHKVSRSQARELGWTEAQINCLDNYVVVSRKANQWKSDMATVEELESFYQGMKTVYYSEAVA